MEIVAKADIGRSTGVGGTGRQLERPSIARCASLPKHELLDLEVAGVGRLLSPVSRELHDERPIGRKREALPEIKRQAAAEPPLCEADRRLNDTDPLGEIGLRQPKELPRPPDLSAGPAKLLPVPASGFSLQFGALEPTHNVPMIAASTWPAITPNSTAAYRFRGPWVSMNTLDER